MVYQAIYEVKNDSLYLNNIIDCFDLIDKRKIDLKKLTERMKELFGDKVQNNKVFIGWFSGNLSFPQKLKESKVIRWDGVFYKIFLHETVLNFENGKMLSSKNV